MVGDAVDVLSEIDFAMRQAESFARGGDFFGALYRARYARDELAPRAAAALADQTEARLLCEDIDLAIAEYRSLADAWQSENKGRHTAFMARERRAIEEPLDPVELPPTSRSVGCRLQVLRR